MSFRLFDYLDPAIVNNEASKPRASRSPAIWPSESSAIRADSKYYRYYGGCALKVFLRLIGWPAAQETEAESPWKWVIGRAVESELTRLTLMAGQFGNETHPSLYVANGVKHYFRDIYMSVETDVVVRDPKTMRGWIIECKSYDGYFAEKKIENEGHPKEENLIQICIYLWQFKTGAQMKEIIKSSLADRARMDEIGREHRNRIEANLEHLEEMDDGPLGAKLVYISRGACARTEFDIEIFQAADGLHYPMVNGNPYKIFSIESIFERFSTIQKFWFRARQEGVRRLSERGFEAPATLPLVLAPGDEGEDYTVDRGLTQEEKFAEINYMNMLEREVRSLPAEEFFPKPEYEYAYSHERIIELGEAKIIGKTKFAEYKAGKITTLGDWQCHYCPFAATGCLARQRPDLAYKMYDLNNLPEEVEVSFG